MPSSEQLVNFENGIEHPTEIVLKRRGGVKFCCRCHGHIDQHREDLTSMAKALSSVTNDIVAIERRIATVATERERSGRLV